MKPFLSCIPRLSLSSANYSEIIQLLKQRFANPQMLINAYMKRFVQLPVIKSNNDVFELRKLYNQVESSVRNLKFLQMDIGGYKWTLVVTNGHWWLQMDTGSYKWTLVVTHGQWWLQMDTGGYRTLLVPSTSI